MALETVIAPAKGAPRRREDDKDRVPVEIPRDQWDRPEIIQLDASGKPRTTTVDGVTDFVRKGYTRASGLGKILEDETAITKWKLRVLAWAIVRHEDLRLRAQSIATTEEKEDKKELDAIVALALDRGGAGNKARIGSALHALTERVDKGLSIPDVGTHRFALDAYAEVMGDWFEVLDSEVFVVHDQLKTAGTFDRRVRTKVWLQPCDGKGRPVGDPLPPGTILVLDLKTSGTADYFGIGFAVQTAVYDGGCRYDPATGARTPLETHGRWALILHVPSGGNVAELHWVDLERGRYLADLAVTVKGERSKSKSLINLAKIHPWRDAEVQAAAEPAAVPGEPPAIPAAAVVTSASPVLAAPEPATHAGAIFASVHAAHVHARLLELIGKAATEDDLLDAYRTNWRVWREEHTAAAGARSAVLAARAAAEQGETAAAS